MEFTRKMIDSKEKVDSNLINLYKIFKLHRMNESAKAITNDEPSLIYPYDRISPIPTAREVKEVREVREVVEDLKNEDDIIDYREAEKIAKVSGKKMH